ncbi:MAG: hypothetical protein K940chlam3_00939 [Chlamydiae bacterium]|nr:hypothetical protein [Chlamydiota bacterium]
MEFDWRHIIYPIGFLANFLFAIRFIYQWFYSEAKQKSIVNSGFWKISLLGNFVMMVHTMIQLQFGVCVIQAWNGVISWRNLNLMKDTSKQAKLPTVLFFFLFASGVVIMSFLIQSWVFFDGEFIWARTPTFLGKQDDLPLAWHLVGIAGVILFASRFWVQWWRSEMHQKSHVGRTFWWISLIGATISAIYFIRLHDIVNCVGPTLGLIPYIRNLMLINKHRSKKAMVKS